MLVVITLCLDGRITSSQKCKTDTNWRMPQLPARLPARPLHCLHSPEPQVYRPKWCTLHYWNTIALVEVKLSNIIQHGKLITSIAATSDSNGQSSIRTQWQHIILLVESSHAEELVKSPSESLQLRAERPGTCLEWCTQVGSLFFCCVFVSLQQEYDGATGYRRPRVISDEQGLTYQKSRGLVHNSTW